MQCAGKPINGLELLDLLDLLDLLSLKPPPPDTGLDKEPGATRFAQLRAG
ncbi:hypothetical protein [Streptomyces sp. NPDC055107]